MYLACTYLQAARYNATLRPGSLVYAHRINTFRIPRNSSVVNYLDSGPFRGVESAQTPSGSGPPNL